MTKETTLTTFKNCVDLFRSKDIPFENIGLNGETQIKINYNELTKSIQIVYQGTVSVFDTLIDLFFFPRIRKTKCVTHNSSSCDSLFKHSGFDIVYDHCKHYILSQVDELLKTHPECKTISQFGWSLGATTAIQMHLLLAEGYSDLVTVNTVTIGSPRIFFNPIFTPWKLSKWKYAKSLTENLTMFRNKLDLIPRLPPVLFGFIHIKKAIVLKQPIKEIFDIIMNHELSRYEKNIEKYCMV